MNPLTIETKKLLRKLLRNSESHKGDFGHVLVVAGNIGFGGAALLSSKAAIKIGAGLVSLATRSEHLQAALSFAPEVMTKPVDSGQSLENYLDFSHCNLFRPRIRKRLLERTDDLQVSREHS